MPFTEIILISIGCSKSFLCNILMTVGMPSKSTATSGVFRLRSGRKCDLKVLPSAFSHEYTSRLVIFGIGLPIIRYQSQDLFVH